MSVAIVIIVHKSYLSVNEQISLIQVSRVLGKHSIHLICPYGLDVTAHLQIAPRLIVNRVDPACLSTYRNFNIFKMTFNIYKLFSDYDFILFYELDCFVFRDELENWCNNGFDYIGAPWFENFHLASENSLPLGVGNGGFSLRKVASALKVLRTFGYIEPPKKLWFKYKMGKIGFGDLVRRLTVGNNTLWIFNDFRDNEDKFWGLEVPKAHSWFEVAPFEKAFMFSMETNPRRLFLLNRDRLPFGCHAWWRYDYEFWAPHIRSFGYSPIPQKYEG